MKRVPDSPILEAFTSRPPYRLLLAHKTDPFEADFAWQKLADDCVTYEDRLAVRSANSRRDRTSDMGSTVVATLNYSDSRFDKFWLAGAASYRLASSNADYLDAVLGRNMLPIVNKLAVRRPLADRYELIAGFLLASVATQADEARRVGVRMSKLDKRGSDYCQSIMGKDKDWGTTIESV